MLPPLTMRETALEAMKFCFLWFLANYFSNAALQYTNVSSFTIISSMSGFFTLFIGVSVDVEKFTWVKLGALVISYKTICLSHANFLESREWPLSHYKTLKPQAHRRRSPTSCCSETSSPCSVLDFTAVIPHFSSFVFNTRVALIWLFSSVSSVFTV